jgi:serine/threonine protein kinase
MENKIFNKETRRYLKKDSAYYKQLVNKGWHINEKGEFSPPSKLQKSPPNLQTSPPNLQTSLPILPKSPRNVQRSLSNLQTSPNLQISPISSAETSPVILQKYPEMDILSKNIIDHLDINDLLSLYLSSKEQQKILNNTDIIKKLNQKYNIYIDTASFPVWYQFYMSEKLPENVRYLYTLEETRYSDKIELLSGDITERMILILFDWLYQVRKSLKLETYVSGYTHTLIFILLTKLKINSDELQLYGTVCLHLAAVMLDEITPEYKDYIYIADKNFNEKEFRKALTTAMNIFNGQLIFPSPILFIDRNNNDVYILTLLASMMLDLTSFKPSLIAATCTYMITGEKLIYSMQEISTVCLIMNKFLQQHKKIKLDVIKLRIEVILPLIKYSCGEGQENRVINKLKYNEPWHLGDFDNMLILGKGAYGQVKSVKRKQCGTEYAVKTSNIEEQSKLDPTFIEIGILSTIKKEPNIIQLCSFEYRENELDLVLPLFDSNLKTRPTGDLMPYFKQILQAVVECHRYDIIHRDIKLDNIVIKRDKVVLIDFGISLPFQSVNKNKLMDMANTMNYRPPECLLGIEYNYDQSIDIWAIGCVFYYLVTGNYVSTNGYGSAVLDDIFMLLGTPTIEEWPGLPKLTNMKTLSKYRDNKPQLRKTLAPYDNLILDCLTMDPTKRPTAKQLLEKYF